MSVRVSLHGFRKLLTPNTIGLVWERVDGKVTTTVDIESRLRQMAIEEGLDPDEVMAEARQVMRELGS